jgi:hypothetical protein
MRRRGGVTRLPNQAPELAADAAQEQLTASDEVEAADVVSEDLMPEASESAKAAETETAPEAQPGELAETVEEAPAPATAETPEAQAGEGAPTAAEKRE